ncbi:hypothetical protein VK66_20625 [Stenotrophomonas maltophilia]|nr:hypothetical protein VK66_20625 [Stenotrophomonas maltophilia]
MGAHQGHKTSGACYAYTQEPSASLEWLLFRPFIQKCALEGAFDQHDPIKFLAFGFMNIH